MGRAIELRNGSYSRELTRSSCVEGHVGGPKKVDLGQRIPPESKEFGTFRYALCTRIGRSQWSLAASGGRQAVTGR
jgi:hypothetical protein